jgi:hypothetical protein
LCAIGAQSRARWKKVRDGGDEEGEYKERIGRRLPRIFVDLRWHARRIEVAAQNAWLHRVFPHVAV